ncbi:MAG TPA: EAL domain-containing protein [Burkholderiaceae bacterium]
MRNWKLLSVWPVLGLIVIGVLWFAEQSQVELDRRAAANDGLRDAATLSKAYARYIDRSLEQADQLSLFIQHEWEHRGNSLKLEELSQLGIFPASQYAFVSIINRDGIVLTGSLSATSVNSLADRDYFQFHKHHADTSLRIGTPTVGRISKRIVIQLTRRLVDGQGNFDGVLLIAVEPAQLTSFYDNASFGKHGLLALIGQDGRVRAGRVGEDMLQLPHEHALPLIAGDVATSALYDRQWFADRQARYVGQSPLGHFPMVAIAGFSEQERLSPYQDTWHAFEMFAVAGTIVIVMFIVIAGLLSARLIWRNQRESEVRLTYRLATESGHDGFYMLRALRDRSQQVVDFEVADCNERGAAFTGLPSSQLVGKLLSQLYPKPYFYVVLDMFRKAMEEGFNESELQIPPESPVKLEWIEYKMIRSGTGLALTARDISHAKRHERELWNMANEDALTALPNRKWMAAHLPGALKRAEDSGEMLALLFIDLDDFKDVNDTQGHSAGDELLRLAAERIKAVLRPSDYVVRLGGDEFIVILNPVADKSHVVHVADRIANTLKQPASLSATTQDTTGQRIASIAASIGIAIFPGDGTDIETLLKNSDIAMYHAKAEGKGHFRFYDQSLSDNLTRRLDTERALQLSIEQNRFELFYQPRVDSVTGELRSMEALVRWRHPERGLVLPLEFIPLAERSDLIMRLGTLIVNLACAQIAQWQDQGYPVVPISINVSPRQFHRGDVYALFASALSRHHVNAALVEIEITESLMMGEAENIDATLSKLRKLGIKLLIDDFGTGYSSLSQLQRLDMDVLKVDRAFTSELGLSREGEVFFNAIVSMAHALGMSVVAEGTETLEQLEVLRGLGCDEVQGFYVARPVTASEAGVMMRKRFLLPEAPNRL